MVLVAELGRGAKDQALVRWCVDHDAVLVTMDEDFRSRPLRMQALLDGGAEVILCTPPPVGARAQVELVVSRFPDWELRVEEGKPAARLWTQGPRGHLKRNR